MLFPKQVPPVQRPHTVPPHQAVEIEKGRPIDLFRIRLDLLHGANHCDPPPFRVRTYQQLKFS